MLAIPTTNAPRYGQPAAELLTLTEAAYLASLHLNTLRQAIKLGRLAALVLGHSYVIERGELEKFLAGRKSLK